MMAFDALAPPARVPLSEPMPWIVRAVERKLSKLISVPGHFLHVAGRRRIGKISTVQRVVAEYIMRVHITLIENSTTDQEADHVLKKLRQCDSHVVEEGIDTCDKLRKSIGSAIRRGIRLVIEEINFATPVLQSALQQAIDEIVWERRLYPGATSHYGGLLVLGSFPMEVTEVVHGARRPLFRRFMETVTIYPFFASEMAEVFSACGMSSGFAKLAVYAATGGYPALLRCVWEVLRPDIDLQTLLRTLYCSDQQTKLRQSMERFFADELPRHSVALQVVSTTHKSVRDQEDELRNKLSTDKRNDSPRVLLQDLEDHGVISRHSPICPSVVKLTKIAKRPACVAGETGVISSYVVEDAPLKTFQDLYKTSRSLPLPAETPFSPSLLQKVEGGRLKEWVLRILNDRVHVHASYIPCYPELGLPDIMYGNWCGFTGVEIDGICLFHDQRTVVWITVKRDADTAVDDVLCQSNTSVSAHVERLTEALIAADVAEIELSDNERALIEYTSCFLAVAPEFSEDHRRRVQPASSPSILVRLCDVNELLRFDAPTNTTKSAHPASFGLASFAVVGLLFYLGSAAHSYFKRKLV